MAENVAHLAADLYELVLAWEPVHHTSASPTNGLREKAADLAERFARARGRAASSMAVTLAETSENLQVFVNELARNHPRFAELRARARSLGANYEALVALINRHRVPVPAGLELRHLKPKNYWRNAFHVANGLLAVLLYELLLDRRGTLIGAGAVLAVFAVMDLSRRVFPVVSRIYVDLLFAKIARPSEAHRIPGATWFAAALLVGCWIYPRTAIELGVVALAFGDPVASLAGKRWGRQQLIGEKSLAGTLGFAIASFTAALVFLLVARPALTLPLALVVSAAVAVTGALAELLSNRIDDNFTIPLVAGGAAALLLLL